MVDHLDIKFNVATMHHLSGGETNEQLSIKRKRKKSRFVRSENQLIHFR